MKVNEKLGFQETRNKKLGLKPMVWKMKLMFLKVYNKITARSIAHVLKTCLMCKNVKAFELWMCLLHLFLHSFMWHFEIRMDTLLMERNFFCEVWQMFLKRFIVTEKGSILMLVLWRNNKRRKFATSSKKTSLKFCPFLKQDSTPRTHFAFTFRIFLSCQRKGERARRYF